MDHPTSCWNCGGSTFHETKHATFRKYICVRKGCGKAQSFRVRNAKNIKLPDEWWPEAWNPFAGSNQGSW